MNSKPSHRSSSTPYRGRFAPSPTGPLHFGSLVAAVGSFLQARTQGGQWLVRMEDLDAQRNQAGAAEDIIRTLELYGFEWDEAISYQSQRLAHYAQALQSLQRQHKTYACVCSRKTVRQLMDRLGVNVYPGTCRHRNVPQEASAKAIRVRVTETQIGFSDPCQGLYSQALASEVGDFVIRRADGFFAYQLAVVVDDHLQGITEVVRGADLLDNTPRQIYLQRLLGYSTPAYLHLPVVRHPGGEKLSKQTGAQALSSLKTGESLCQALAFLGHPPPKELHRTDLDTIWHWAKAHWQPGNIPAAAKSSYPLILHG